MVYLVMSYVAGHSINLGTHTDMLVVVVGDVSVLTSKGHGNYFTDLLFL